jgi:A/G-specific adenine glycosylase
MARVGGLSPTRTAAGQVCPGAGAASLSGTQILTLRRSLLRWGRSHFEEYPWRSERDPWLSFLAELLLQRTRASQVEAVFLRIREQFPTAASLAVGGLPAISELTGRLGLHWRGPLLLRIAEAIADLGGSPPETAEELRRLKGVGMYTAGAWLSLHRGKRVAIIDANIARWLSRITGLPYNRDPRHVEWIKELAERLTPRRRFRDFNYAALDFTMKICVPRNPRCHACPLQRECRYASNGGPQADRTGDLRIRREEEDERQLRRGHCRGGDREELPGADCPTDVNLS